MKIEEILKKPVKERSDDEHLFLIKYKYKGSVRDYLLSMGAFKELKVTEDAVIKEKIEEMQKELWSAIDNVDDVSTQLLDILTLVHQIVTVPMHTESDDGRD